MYIGFPSFVSPNMMIDILLKYVDPYTIYIFRKKDKLLYS